MSKAPHTPDYQDDGTGRVKLFDRNGRSVYTGRHLPFKRTLLGRRYPPMVEYGGMTFLNSHRTTWDFFHIYHQVPEVPSWN